MFEKYVTFNSKFVKIPLPKGREEFYLTEEGQIFSYKTGYCHCKRDRNGDWSVKLDLWNGVGEYKVALITLITFGKLRLPKKHYHLVEPFHIDGNKNNLHPANIGYRYTRPIEVDDYPGYFYPPFFNRYGINRKGDVIRLKNGVRVKKYTTKPGKNKIKGGYINYTLFSDPSNFTIGRHRLLGLTFKHYPDNVDKMDVNHIDGVPGNDWLDNLEWATRQRNIEHAFQTGLRNQNFTFYGYNIFTGIHLEFHSAQAAARYTGGHVHSILKYLDDGLQRLYTNGWLFKKDINIPWREVEDPYEELRSVSSPTEVFSKNVFTGEIRRHESMTKAGKDVGLKNPGQVGLRLASKKQRPYYGYLFKLATDETPWPEYSERELAVFRDNPASRARGVIARRSNGDELFFTNTTKAAQFFHQTLKTADDVDKAILRKRNVDGYTLTRL